MTAAAPALEGDAIEVAVEATAIDSIDARLASQSGLSSGGCAVGTVVRTGPASGELEGTRVVIGPFDPCGECHVCRRGAAGACPQARRRCRDIDGGLAGSVIARGRHALVLTGPLDVPGPLAALVGGPAALAFALLTRLGVGPGDPVVAAGTGAVPGLVHQLAKALGAPATLLAANGDVADIADEVARAAAALEWEDRPRKIVCAGAPAPLVEELVALAGPASSLALGPGCAATLAGDTLIAAERAVIGLRGAHPDLFPEVAAFIVRGELNLADCVEQVSLADGAASIKRLDAIERSGKTLLAVA